MIGKLRKVKFLKDFNSFKKDTYRVIMEETALHYRIQVNLDSDELYWIHKSDNGVLFKVVERSQILKEKILLFNVIVNFIREE